MKDNTFEMFLLLLRKIEAIENTLEIIKFQIEEQGK